MFVKEISARQMGNLWWREGVLGTNKIVRGPLDGGKSSCDGDYNKMIQGRSARTTIPSQVVKEGDKAVRVLDSMSYEAPRRGE